MNGQTSHGKALAILPYCGVKARDTQGRITSIEAPASAKFQEGKRGAPRTASVSIERKADTVALACVHNDGEQCAALASVTPQGEPKKPMICYHCRAALLAIAAESACALEVHTGKEYAERAITKHGGGRLLTCTTTSGAPLAFVALLPKAKRQAPPVKAEPKQEAGLLAVAVACKDCGGPLPSIQEEANRTCNKCAGFPDTPATVAPLALFDSSGSAYDNPPARQRRKRNAR